METTQLITDILNGVYDSSIHEIAAAARTRKSAVLDIQSGFAKAAALSTFKVNDPFKLSAQVRPKRLVGRTGKIVGVGRTRFKVILDEPDARFNGVVTVPADLIEAI